MCGPHKEGTGQNGMGNRNTGIGYTMEALRELKIDAPDEEIREKVLANWDRVAKPLDGMGRFERLLAQVGAIHGRPEIDIAKKAVVIFCADNGIVAEGISQSGQEVTLAVAKNMAAKSSSVGRMAACIGADTIPVDVGINHRETIVGVLDRKIRCGTRNFRVEPAMTQTEAVQSVFTGIEMAACCKERGYHMLATGEMGIGNTTTSSAVAAALLELPAMQVTGRGAGLTDEKLCRKCEVIEEALKKYGLRGADPVRVLTAVGGLDIGALAGLCIGGALYHLPIVLDGVISMTAALLAERIAPGTKAYLLASHKGKEPATEKLAQALGLAPVIDGELALGEGTGAVMLFSLLDMAAAVYRDSSTFVDIQIENYKRA